MLFIVEKQDVAGESEWGLFEIKDPDTGIRKLRPLRLQVNVEAARSLEKPAAEEKNEAENLVTGIDITLRACAADVLMFSAEGKKFYDNPPTLDPKTGRIIPPKP